MDTPKSRIRGSSLVYVMGIVIAYLAGVGTPKLVETVTPSTSSTDASREKGRGETLSATGDDHAADRKRGERPGNPTPGGITTDRIRSAFQISDSVRGQLEFARLMNEADAETIAEIREMFF
ncbi:MAG: hypothetical protein EOP85_19435, partial [Verrucomicrobiaceae bacterium]